MQQGYEQLPQALPVAQAVAAQPARPNALPIAQRVATVLATPAVTHDAMLYALEAGDGWGQPGPYCGVGMGGVANRRDWSGGLHQCCGAGSSRDWQICFLSFCCMPVPFGTNLKRSLGLDMLQQSMLCLVCVSFFHWILALVYAKCGSVPLLPVDYADASDFQWSAWEQSTSSYNSCMRGYAPWKSVLYAITWCFYAYGGYRRIQMRRRFGLPGDDVRDYFSWLFCPWCALAQESRTLAANRVESGVWNGPPVLMAPGVQFAPQPQTMAAQPQAWGAQQQPAWGAPQSYTVQGYAAVGAETQQAKEAAKEEESSLLLDDEPRYAPPPPPVAPPTQPPAAAP